MKQADTKIKPVSVDINAYDIAVIGMPVWASNPPGVIKTFIKQSKPKDRKIILFAVSKSGNDGKTLERTAGYLAGNEIIKSLSIKENTAVSLDWINDIK